MLAVNLKDSRGQQLVRRLALNHDVLLEPYRPGVMEQLNLGPDLLCQDNPRLIYARLTGFGRDGCLSERAGHDINFLAMSGVLSMLKKRNKKPQPPINLLADFAGGSVLCALGICLALLERSRSGLGQVVDSSMVEGAAYVASWLFASRSLPMLWSGSKPGTNLLDGGAYFYNVYKTKDDKYMSVGALEPQFFEVFKDKLDLPHLEQNILDQEEMKKAKEQVTAAFLQKTQAEWCQIFEDHDACVYPVLDWREAHHHPHNQDMDTFEIVDDLPLPRPAPRLSRTPGYLIPTSRSSFENPSAELEDALKLLLEEVITDKDELKELIDDNVIALSANAKL